MGLLLLGLFTVFTALIQTADVRPIGPDGTKVGFAAVNSWFRRLTGVNMTLYTITDWLGLVPIFVCLLFGMLGLVQLVKRRSLFKVDPDILLLGAYYLLVMTAYLAFEMIPINHRPVLIDGRLEASYPSSTTLLVLSVMPTLSMQARRRLRGVMAQRAIGAVAGVFSMLMVSGRLVSGVHWLTDIVGAVLLSAGLLCIYRAAVIRYDRKKR
ncbi:MAG: phosphatase PAP2 family protein [Clostridia bacterium]|nr:phosphatase PAP2 family protein [Clostridia bacterium]